MPVGAIMEIARRMHSAPCSQPGGKMSDSMEQAIFAGGCFWCMEPVFRALEGIQDVEAGYCGGTLHSPSYEQVCSGDTGHVEAVRVTFDSAQVSYATLCEVFFGTHDPTTPDRQGHDVGPQYASVIFVADERQRQQAIQARDAAQEAFADPVCTRIESAPAFWPAEPGHQEYYANHPEQGYCQFVIRPKMAKFRKHFGALLRRA